MDRYLGQPLEVVATYKTVEELQEHTSEHKMHDIVVCEELGQHLLKLPVGVYPWLEVGNPCNVCGILSEELFQINITTWKRNEQGIVTNVQTPIKICRGCINTVGDVMNTKEFKIQQG